MNFFEKRQIKFFITNLLIETLLPRRWVKPQLQNLFVYLFLTAAIWSWWTKPTLFQVLIRKLIPCVKLSVQWQNVHYCWKLISSANDLIYQCILIYSTVSTWSRTDPNTNNIWRFPTFSMNINIRIFFSFFIKENHSILFI